MNFTGIDNPDSERYQFSASANGIGSCNNSLIPTAWVPTGGYGAVNEGNTSRRERMRDTSFDPNSAGNLMTINNAAWNAGLAKNYVANSNSTALAATPVVWYILATIPMSQIHPIFKKLHLTKNMYMKLDFTFNTNFSTVFTLAATTFTAMSNTGSAPVSLYDKSTWINKWCISTCVSLTAGIQIGKATIEGTQHIHSFNSCRIYNCTYTLSPIQEQVYLKAVPKKLSYIMIITIVILIY